jgi:hypothetical protein
MSHIEALAISWNILGNSNSLVPPQPAKLEIMRVECRYLYFNKSSR